MKRFFTGLFAVITCIPALIYFAGCFTPCISPVHFWPMAFVALGFPYVALVILVFAFLWFFIRRKIALFLLLLFFAGSQNLFVIFALHPFATSTFTKDTGSIRILTWNVRGFGNPSISPDSNYSVRKRMFDYIDAVKPDVICMQEFAEHHLPGTFSNTADLERLGYKYYLKTNEIIHTYPAGTILTGTAIFSKIPFSDSGRVMLGDTTYPEYLAFADVSLHNKTIRVFATHLKSLNLFAHPEDSLNRVTLFGDSMFVYRSTKSEKLKAFAQAHAKEALIAKAAINKSPFAAVVGADMNSVPASYPYHIISSGLQDPFVLNGWGIGTTMDDLPKPLRIDILLADKKLSVINFCRDEVHLSDHFPQYTDVVWKK